MRHVGIPHRTWLLTALLIGATTSAAAADVVIKSEVLDFGALRPGSSRTIEIVAENTGTDRVTLSDFQVECTRCTKVPKEPVEIQPGASVKIPVTYTAQPGEDGPITKHISFATTNVKRPKVNLAFQVVVGTSAAILPGTLNLERRAPGADVTAELTIVNLSDEPLTALYATGPVDGPKLTLPRAAIAAGQTAKISATWHLPAKLGPVSGQVVVFVDHPKITRLTLPYQVIIAETPATQATTQSASTTANALHASTGPTTAAAPAIAPAIAPPATRAAVPMVNLDLKESLPLKDFVDIVGAQLKLNFIYEESQLAAPVSIRLNTPLPADALLPLLKTVLQAKGMAMVTTERPEIWRIVTSREALGLAEPGRAVNPNGPEQIVTELLHPTSLDLEAAAGILRSFQTAGLGQVTTLASAKALVVTDYAPQVVRLKKLLELVDKPQATASVEVISLKAAEPTPLVDRVTKLLTQLARAENRPDNDKIFLTPDEEGMSVTVIAPAGQLPRITELIKRFDTAPVLARVDYPVTDQTRNTALETIRQVLGASAGTMGHDGVPRIVTATLRLSVLATEGQHKRIKELLGQQDLGNDTGMQIRAYTIQNRDATEIQATLSRLLGDAHSGNLNIVLTPSRLRSGGITTTDGVTMVGNPVPPPEKTGTPTVAMVPPSPGAVTSGPVNITVDAGTNTLLIATTADMHKKLASLIEQLDKKQAQVLLEVMLVSVADSDTLGYAVDAAIKASIGGATIGIGTDVGISQGDFIKGRTPTVGPGLNGAIFNPGSFSLFMRALQSTNKAKVLSLPQVLALDNKAAIVRSLQQQPFTSVNASSTVATTSFGGFAEAGTTLELTPHIAPADYLNLEYRLELSSFTGDATTSGGATVPPPRRSDTISSFVSVPDGSVVIVGGLTSNSDTKSVSKVPVLGDIPILGLLGRSENTSHNNAMFYVFVRPTILRSQSFEDLKFVSQESKRLVGVASEFPESKLHYLP